MIASRNRLTSSTNASKQFGEYSSRTPFSKQSLSPSDGMFKKLRHSSSCESEKETSIGSNEHTSGDFGRLEDFHIDLTYASRAVPKKKVDENKYKTEICKNWAMYGYCKYEFNCKFAHGDNELQEKAVPYKEKYKTKGCLTFYTQGHCPYGSRCLFLHMEEHNPEEAKFRGPFRRALASFSEGRKLVQPKYRLNALSKASYYLQAPDYSPKFPLEDFNIGSDLFMKEIERIEESKFSSEELEITISLDFLD